MSVQNKPSFEIPSNVLSLLIFCTADSSVMLTLDNANSDHYIPYVKADPNISWSRLIAKEAQEIIGVKPAVKLLRLNKIWNPRKEGSTILWHCIFQLAVDANVKNKTKNTMGKYRGKIRWITESDLLGLLQSNSLKSPEILELYQLAKDVENNHLNVEIPEDIISNKNICEIIDEALVSGKLTNYQQLVEASGIDKLAQEELYRNVFLSLCFPAMYMNLRAFTRFIPELGWAKPQAPFLFRSADMNDRNGLSFREFLYFLAAIDPNTGHGGTAAELRCRYMFKYYDRDKDNALKIEEFKNLILDLRKSKKLTVDIASITKETQDTYKAMGIQETQSINVNDFLRAVCDLKIRGTSHIFRSGIGVIKYLKDNASGERPVGILETATAKPSLMYSVPSEHPRGKMTLKCFDYELAVHTVKIQRSGQAINIDEMKELSLPPCCCVLWRKQRSLLQVRNDLYSVFQELGKTLYDFHTVFLEYGFNTFLHPIQSFECAHYLGKKGM